MRTDWDCIAFVHTVGWEERDRNGDALADFDGLVAWLADRGHLTPVEADGIRARAREQPGRGAATLGRARRFRTLAYEIFRAVGGGERVAPAWLDELNATLEYVLPNRRLAADGNTFRWEWRMDPVRLDSLLAPVVWSLATLLTSEESERLKVCEADDCGWVFVDASRNRSRRWCDMSDCGNRAKVRRYRKRRGAGSG